MFLFSLLFMLLILFPEITHNGIKNGLILLVNQVIPSLYPFILLSAYLRKHLKHTTSSILILISLLSGYPIGAKIVTEHDFKSFPLSKQQLLLFCNMPSPSYIISYVGYKCLKQSFPGILIYISIIVGNIGTILFQILFSKLLKNPPSHSFILSCCNIDTDLNTNEHDFVSLSQETFFTLLNISSYLLIFNIAASFIKQITWIPNPLNSIIIALFEMTTGINELTNTGIHLHSKLIFITGILTFGGFSVIAQTHGMIHSTNLSIKKYMTDKAIASCIAMSVMYGFTLLFN